MWLPSALLVYAALGTAFGGSVLRWKDWDRRLPRLALLAWQASLISVTGAAAIGLLTMSHHGWESLLTSTLHADSRAVHTTYDLPHVPTGTVIAAAIGTLLTVRLLWALAVTAHTVRQRRQRHRYLLRVLSHPAETHSPGVPLSVVDADQPTVYCLPGPRARTVVTTAALHRLTPEQFAAALAHEHAHLRFRHHWLLTWGTALRAAFAPLPLFADFGAAAARLVEMAADDEAGRQQGRTHTASALLALSGPAPAGSLPAGCATIERIERLVEPPPVHRQTVVAVIASGAAALLAFPPVIALIPALALIGSAH